MFKRIDHVEIVTDKPEETARFYTEVLGFRVKAQDHIERPGGTSLDLTYLDLGGTTVELINYVTGPVGFAAGDKQIDAALVGETAGEIVVGFRGTLPPDSPDHLQMIRDWANDCDALLVEHGGFTGRVHQGFLGTLEDL